MSTRAPEQKIAAIRAAAADLLISHGPGKLTHRAVAVSAGVSVGTTTKYFASIAQLRKSALDLIYEEVDNDLQELRARLEESTDPVRTLAVLVVQQLGDQAVVQRECALTSAGLFDPDFRDVSVQWYAGLQETLTPYLGEVSARIFARYIDGALLSTSITGKSPTVEEVHGLLVATTKCLEKP